MPNHRDLIVISRLDDVAPSEPVDLEDPFLKTNFRKTLAVSAKTTDLESREAF